MYYPIFLNLENSTCLIIGAGKVGLRKAEGLLQANTYKILILDTEEFNKSFLELAKNNHVELLQGRFEKEHLQGCSLVFACTNNSELNSHIAKLCAEQNILCNCIDAPLEGNFIVPATARAKHKLKNGLMAALSTEGASPAFAKVLRKDLEEWLTPYASMTILLGRLRPLVLALDCNSEHNKEVFRSIVNSDLSKHLASGDILQCKELLQNLLPESLHNKIVELLYDIF